MPWSYINPKLSKEPISFLPPTIYRYAPLDDVIDSTMATAVCHPAPVCHIDFATPSIARSQFAFARIKGNVCLVQSTSSIHRVYHLNNRFDTTHTL
jgi:hypothetical protein